MLFYRGSAAATQILIYSLFLYHGIEPVQYHGTMMDLDAITLLLEKFIPFFLKMMQLQRIAR